ncbi:glutathione S-transferase family protein [Pseudoroseicyclus tamaricis]|uniref:Glutathione S-transferase family protein n=1 Tax=Pseudoroseicyclus tamaricis TaxID=2705421 RepID=A0A6B2JX07_9RHOB|nr:glutathione S-transferase family protein [Pseudoroseicyclus tamaricis]NDV02748.1 glutathione S-transferase family protein [Pseudoroseicyclus tamaricis]
MITLYHSPVSRATRVLALVHALGALDKVELKPVTIPRMDGSGDRDPSNPHPDGKVPLLVEDGVAAWESGAIMLRLTELFPDAGLGVESGPRRGRFLGWMHWYGSVFEPAYLNMVDGTGAPGTAMHAAIRGVPEAVERLRVALSDGPWLMGEQMTAADFLVASTYIWFPDATPDFAKDWVARVTDHPSYRWAVARDEELMAPA